MTRFENTQRTYDSQAHIHTEKDAGDRTPNEFLFLHYLGWDADQRLCLVGYTRTHRDK